MTASLVEKIADAVLYEGYILYPYRASAVKNQQRWNFGALCPPSYSLAQGATENWSMQTQCLIEGGAASTVKVKVRFLHLLSRRVGRRISHCWLQPGDCAGQELKSPLSEFHFHAVPSLEVNGEIVQAWQEAVEREVSLRQISLPEAASSPIRTTFSFPASEAGEALLSAGSGETVGVVVRKQEEISGAVEVTVARVAHDVFRLTVQILNLTDLANAETSSRDDALLRSLVSTHTILRTEKGAFVSLLDPPEALLEAAAGCSNLGTYPVLAGEADRRDCMLSSPIILYDYPQIAPESAGTLYDSTEIDEILTLRIMTLTDEEKREMRGGDERARQILERTETLPAEQLMKMHGVMKSVKK